MENETVLRLSTPAPTVNRISRTLLMFAASAIAGITAPSPASAQDGKTILKSMMSTYRSLRSYHGQAIAAIRQTMPDGKAVTDQGFTTTFIYQSPNKLKLDFTVPSGG